MGYGGLGCETATQFSAQGLGRRERPDAKISLEPECCEGTCDTNTFLHEIAGEKFSLKDFRTLTACASALEKLAKLEPRPTDAGRGASSRRASCFRSEAEAGQYVGPECRISGDEYVYSRITMSAGRLSVMPRAHSSRSRMAKNLDLHLLEQN